MGNMHDALGVEPKGEAARPRALVRAPLQQPQSEHGRAAGRLVCTFALPAICLYTCSGLVLEMSLSMSIAKRKPTKTCTSTHQTWSSSSCADTRSSSHTCTFHDESWPTHLPSTSDCMPPHARTRMAGSESRRTSSKKKQTVEEAKLLLPRDTYA